MFAVWQKVFLSVKVSVVILNLSANVLPRAETGTICLWSHNTVGGKKGETKLITQGNKSAFSGHY